MRSGRKMHHPSMTLAVLGFVLVLALIGCNSDSESGNGSESGEHSSDSESENGEGGEESGDEGRCRSPDRREAWVVRFQQMARKAPVGF